MSRCFPFPPPGYVRKTKVDDLDLLKKEKNREKKQKKDKDWEKKDGKEKREKERSDEKHREKRDKKEKHRDKKKEKDRDKGNAKSGSSLADEKKVVGLSGAHISIPPEKNKDRERDKGAHLGEKRVAGFSPFCNGEQVSKISNPALENKNNPFVETKSIRNASLESAHKERAINQLPDKNIYTEGKDSEAAKSARIVARPQVDGKERINEKPVFQKMDVHGVVEAAKPKPSGSAVFQNSVEMVQNRVGMGRALEKKVGQRVEGKEKIRYKEGDSRERDEQKGKDREKSIHKDKNREKEKKTEEKVKVFGEEKHMELSRTKSISENHVLKSSVKDGYMKETSSSLNDGLQNVPKDGNRATVGLNNLGKRKDAGPNGIYDEHTTGPNKLARTTTSFHPQAENGRTLEPYQNSTVLVDTKLRPPPMITTVLVDSQQRLPPMNVVKVDHTFAPDDKRKPPMNIKVEDKERKINGSIIPPVTQHSSQPTTKSHKKTDPPSKLPHPDSKYLGQVLSVPKIDERSDFDDQEWLFSSQTREPEIDSSGIDETPQKPMENKRLGDGYSISVPRVYVGPERLLLRVFSTSQFGTTSGLHLKCLQIECKEAISLSDVPQKQDCFRPEAQVSRAVLRPSSMSGV